MKPFVLEHGGPSAHKLLEDVQYRPVDAKQPVEPQIHEALLAIKPSL
tara:strand:- start:177 stop:317 length:141 start_codon:yes stop_codon:yes gene_type:complete